MNVPPLDGELKKGSAEFLILSLVEDRALHGYDIARLIDVRSKGALTFYAASLYPLLYRLERRGWITGRWLGQAGARGQRVEIGRWNLATVGSDVRPAHVVHEDEDDVRARAGLCRRSYSSGGATGYRDGRGSRDDDGKNPASLRPVGEPVPVSTQVAVSGDLFGDIALAETAPGVIAYRASAGSRQFRWFDRSGRFLGASGAPDEAQPSSPRLAPDQGTVLFRRTVNGNTDLWTIESSRSVLRKLTSNAGRDYDAVWSPTGDRMIFNSDRTGVLNLYEQSLTGASTSTDTLLLDTPDHKNTCDWSADARFLLYAVQSVTTAVDLWALPLFGDRKPLLVTQTPGNDLRGQFSPDGKSVAYESNERGRAEIYLQAFPDPIWKVQISTGGGMAPMWRGDGRELFFRSPDGQLMAAGISSGGRPLDSAAIVLFSMPAGPSREGTNWPYAASRDGKRFLVNTFVEGASPITVLLNWKPKD